MAQGKTNPHNEMTAQLVVLSTPRQLKSLTVVQVPRGEALFSSY